jgi:hypothetical protein
LFNTFLKKEISFSEAFGRLALWISGANSRVRYHIAGAFVSFVVCMSHIVTKKIKIKKNCGIYSKKVTSEF